MSKTPISTVQRETLFQTLQERFQKHMHRHEGMNWADVIKRVEANPEKIWSLLQMEETGGEPDVVGQDSKTGEYIFYDCAPESPKGRRSLCYDRAAWEARKEHKPKNTVIDMAKEMGITLLSEEQYRELQQYGPFDTKTSSWIETPENIRRLGGAIFCDYRYGTIFVYHNGADSYYASRGFRGSLRV